MNDVLRLRMSSMDVGVVKCVQNTDLRIGTATHVKNIMHPLDDGNAFQLAE